MHVWCAVGRAGGPEARVLHPGRPAPHRARNGGDHVHDHALRGPVRLVDDMIDTAGTITNAANALKELGAKDVYACATYSILSGPAIERITNSEIKELETRRGSRQGVQPRGDDPLTAWSAFGT